MDVPLLCRICLSTGANNDISDLKSLQSDHTYSEIMFFCLSIQVEDDSSVSTKLCIECMNKIRSFYNFKLLALKNDAYLKSLESGPIIKSEIFPDEELKDEELSYDSDLNAVFLNEELRLNTLKDQSDEEILSTNKIKYEFIPEARGNETKENKKVIKTKKVKKGKKGNNKTDVKSSIFPCWSCNTTFSSNRDRSRHNRRTHLALKKPCPICHKMVKYLKNHILYIHNNSTLPFECVTCGKRFMKPWLLEKHASLHTNVRPHVCDMCDKTFRLREHLMGHKRSVHENDKYRIHLCQFCSKSFTTVGHLERHLRIHTKEKPYQCNDCGKAFAVKTTLINHMYVHSNNMPFKCKLCDMRFSCPRYLTNHMLTHTREKRYHCHYCDMKFHRSDHVIQHEVAVHKINKKHSDELE